MSKFAPVTMLLEFIVGQEVGLSVVDPWHVNFTLPSGTVCTAQLCSGVMVACVKSDEDMHQLIFEGWRRANQSTHSKEE